LRRGRKDLDIDLPKAAVANTIDPLIYMAEQGLGIACLPDFAIRRQLDDGTLVSVLERHIQHSGLFRVLWPSSRYLSPKLRVFVDFMAQNLFQT
jgi:DNA-binding transcriptional LysR family regulator